MASLNLQLAWLNLQSKLKAACYLILYRVFINCNIFSKFIVFVGEIKKVVDPVLVKRTSNTAVITWAAGTRPDLKLYEIELKSERRGLTEVVRTSGLTNSFKLEDLHPGTTYKYRIRAVANNENEKGPWSEALEFTTAGMS